jgi:hypothetical protein
MLPQAIIAFAYGLIQKAKIRGMHKPYMLQYTMFTRRQS